MRLSDRERSAIKSAVAHHFGADAQVWLFGSRADDGRRGGDIDLLVETRLTGRDALRAKIDTITEIQRAIGDQKIDMVTDEPRGLQKAGRQSLIVSNARRDGVAL